MQDEDKKSGIPIPYVRWPESILQNKILQNSVEQISGTKHSEGPKTEETITEEKGLKDQHVQILDDFLPKLLLKYGIQAY
jgi:hypothetical protein